MDENLDDTVVAPRRTAAGSVDAGEVDVEDTVVVGRPSIARGAAEPPALVEPPQREERPSGSAYHLEPPASAAVSRPPLEQHPATPRGHFRFRLVNKVISLDSVVFVGRKPSNPRIANGEMPRLVRVPSPAREVSSTHVELRQAGDAVVVTDLRSTNGTVVTIPRRKPRKLRQGESVVVTPGTLVDIGDGNVIEILPMQEEHQ